MLAHAGEPIAPHDLWVSWGTDPFVYWALLLAGWLYVRGVRRLWGRAGAGRGIARWQASVFLAGLVVCWVALESPVDAAGSSLFSAHMLQHELLAVVAAPMLVLGDPLVAIAPGLSPKWRRRLGRAERLLTGAGRRSRRAWWLAGWFVVFVVSFWMWHVPTLYEAALESDVVHSVQHVSFLIGALGFWWAVAGRHRFRSVLGGVVLLFAALIQGAWGGALFVFANRAYYEPYRTTTEAWGLTPVQDISLGGVIMWNSGLLFVVGAVTLLGSWLARAEHDRASKSARAAATAHS